MRIWLRWEQFLPRQILISLVSNKYISWIKTNILVKYFTRQILISLVNELDKYILWLKTNIYICQFEENIYLFYKYFHKTDPDTIGQWFRQIYFMIKDKYIRHFFKKIFFYFHKANPDIHILTRLLVHTYSN